MDDKMNERSGAKDIGELQGKVLVFGGVYSNLQALEKLMEIADYLHIPPGNIICTGDVVGYCAEPEASVQAIKHWGIHTIAGNVEIQLRERSDDCGCNFNEGSRCDLFSRRWYPFAQSHLSEDSLQWMEQLPDHLRFKYGKTKAYVLHGSYFDTSEFIFRSTAWEKKRANFEAVQADMILGGHCGLPFHHNQDGLSWLNAGVIGMPANDGTTRVWYMLLDLENGEPVFQHQHFEYDFVRAKLLMEQFKLPREYSKTLETGIWDNCEILPEEEASLQGRAIEL